MNLIQLIACIGLITGCFVLLRISPMDFTEGVFRRITSKPKSIRSEVNESTRRKKKSFLRREIEETQTILRMTGRAAKFPMMCALSLLLFLVGATFALTLGNLFLMPVLAVGMMFVPFWFIRLTANHYKKNIAAELETALSIITTAYLRNEDIQTAVEENIDYLNPPVRSVFVEFLTRIKLVDPDVDAALQDMGTKIDNAVFREWVAALLTCRHDRGLKTILTPIVAKLSDMRIVNGELENLVFEPRKEFITMQVLVIGNIPLLYWLNQDWYDVLMDNPETKHLAVVLTRYVSGSAAAMGGRTNVDTDNPYLVIDLTDLPDDLILPSVYAATGFATDVIVQNGDVGTALLSDELWKLLGANSNPLAADYTMRMVKLIRSQGGIAGVTSQGMADMMALDGGKYGKAILDSCRIKFIMQMEEQEARLVQNILNLTEEEVRLITRFRRGEGLLCIGHNHVPISVFVSPKEYEAITTSPTDRRARNNA